MAKIIGVPASEGAKYELSEKIVNLLELSGLGFNDQVKAIARARVASQPRMSQMDWRAKAKPILKPKEKGKKVEK